MITHEMMTEQLRLEEEMRDVTRSRYFKLHEKADERGEFADTHAGRNIMDHTLSVFIEAIDNWVEERKAGKAGRRPRAVKMIEEFNDTPAMAFIFIKHLFGTVSVLGGSSGKQAGAKKTRVVLSCTQAIHDELRMRYFADNRKALLKQLVKDFQQRDLPRRRRRELMIKQFHAQQIVWEAPGWGRPERTNLGIVLFELFKEATGVIEEFKVIERTNKTVWHLAFTEEFVDIVADRMDKVADYMTYYYPTVIPPRPWSPNALVGGGYYSENVKPYKLIKGARMRYLENLEARNISEVLKPINAIQETAWRVNPVMVEVLDYVYAYNIEVSGLPLADPREIPPAPPGVEDDEDIAKEYRKDCYMVHDENRRMISKRLAVLTTLSLANKFKDYSAIYFPHDLDSRGRAYPKVPFLSPQGPDYVKSLLEFSEGKPIETEEHAAYLAIAIANAWGQDKLPLADRVEWVEDNEVMLQEIAMDPLRDLRWMNADEPFMALRGALEWREFCVEGFGYLSHMPVHFDATCSGLQHFSALLLDSEGGFHVNLTDCPERQDIYGAVAKKAEASLRLAADTCDIARISLELGISRSLCKRPVMIVPYAGTFSSCMDYVHDHYRERIAAGEKFPVDTKTLRNKVVPLVSKHVWAAIAETVIAAREAMDWITKSARIVSKHRPAPEDDRGIPIQWTTPDGFVILQEKLMEKSMSVETYLDGSRRIQTTIIKDLNQLDPKKMSQSLSPNYIHSLDACHLRKSVSKAMEIGGMHFAMIHDSFGVHACDMPVFVEECIKPAFYEMYAGTELLDKFASELTAGINTEFVTEEELEHLTTLPTAGSLDIEEVLCNQFFFS